MFYEKQRPFACKIPYEKNKQLDEKQPVTFIILNELNDKHGKISG